MQDKYPVMEKPGLEHGVRMLTDGGVSLTSVVLEETLADGMIMYIPGGLDGLPGLKLPKGLEVDSFDTILGKFSNEPTLNLVTSGTQEVRHGYHVVLL
jgi:hypothetical protein